MRILDIVVNLWTPDLTKNYTPKLNHFWKQIHILGETGDGITLEDEIAKMDAAGIEKGLMIATTGGWSGSDIFFEKPLERIAEVVERAPEPIQGSHRHQPHQHRALGRQDRDRGQGARIRGCAPLSALVRQGTG